MQFGPLLERDIRTLEALLEKEGATCVVTVNQELLKQSRERREDVYTRGPYVGDSAFFYIDIDTKDLLIVRGTLERMGFVVSAEPVTPEPEVPEYLCPRCSYESPAPGLCPKHRIRLLEFSDWHQARKLAAEKSNRPFVQLFVMVVLSLLFYAFITDEGMVSSLLDYLKSIK